MRVFDNTRSCVTPQTGLIAAASVKCQPVKDLLCNYSLHKIYRHRVLVQSTFLFVCFFLTTGSAIFPSACSSGSDITANHSMAQ